MLYPLGNAVSTGIALHRRRDYKVERMNQPQLPLLSHPSTHMPYFLEVVRTLHQGRLRRVEGIFFFKFKIAVASSIVTRGSPQKRYGSAGVTPNFLSPSLSLSHLLFRSLLS